MHRLIEGQGVRFALLGSSARKLKTAGTNLLAGRALRKVMYPLTAAELGDGFDLEQVLRFGIYSPGLDSKPPEGSHLFLSGGLRRVHAMRSRLVPGAPWLVCGIGRSQRRQWRRRDAVHPLAHGDR